MIILTAERTLRARRWEDLGLPRTKEGLREARTLLHPDVNPSPHASDAFARLQGLFEAPEFHVRVAHGSRDGAGAIKWSPEPGFEDLTGIALTAAAELSRTKHARFFTAASPEPGGLRSQYGQTGERWWFLREFAALDGRTAVWVAKRLAGALATAKTVGWTHGDVNPDTVAILPSDHGLQLDGWWYGVRIDERLGLRPTSPHTPPQYLSGYPVDARLAVAQGAGMLRDLLGTSGPPALVSALTRHTLKPESPKDFFTDIEKAAHSLYGSPAWHPCAEPGIEPI